MRWRTEIQIALLIVGVVVWGLGQRTGAVWLQYAGIVSFGVATLLRFFKQRQE